MAIKKIADKGTDFGVTLVHAKIVGSRALLMANGAQVNPFNPTMQEIKKITNKRASMTLDDRLNVAKLQFQAALWLGQDGLPCIPSDAIDGVIRDGGTFQKKGKAIQKYVLCLGDGAKLHYDGDAKIKSVADLVKNFDEFKHEARTVVGNDSSVWNTRPKFKNWWVEFDLQITTGGDIDVADVKAALEHGGRTVGLGSWHRRYGFFTVESFKTVS